MVAFLGCLDNGSESSLGGVLGVPCSAFLGGVPLGRCGDGKFDGSLRLASSLWRCVGLSDVLFWGEKLEVVEGVVACVSVPVVDVMPLRSWSVGLFPHSVVKIRRVVLEIQAVAAPRAVRIAAINLPVELSLLCARVHNLSVSCCIASAMGIHAFLASLQTGCSSVLSMVRPLSSM